MTAVLERPGVKREVPFWLNENAQKIDEYGIVAGNNPMKFVDPTGLDYWWNYDEATGKPKPPKPEITPDFGTGLKNIKYMIQHRKEAWDAASPETRLIAREVGAVTGASSLRNAAAEVGSKDGEFIAKALGYKTAAEVIEKGSLIGKVVEVANGFLDYLDEKVDEYCENQKDGKR
jgi:hypothetical protein